MKGPEQILSRLMERYPIETHDMTKPGHYKREIYKPKVPQYSKT